MDSVALDELRRRETEHVEAADGCTVREDLILLTPAERDALFSYLDAVNRCMGMRVGRYSPDKRRYTVIDAVSMHGKVYALDSAIALGDGDNLVLNTGNMQAYIARAKGLVQETVELYEVEALVDRELAFPPSR